jgi:selenocysteine lyase/cysteine desulfurase
MKHDNGAPMVKIFGPETMDRRGSTVAFYLLDSEGRPYDVYEFEAKAGARLISVRTGCFCNPGDGEIAHEVDRTQIAECFDEPERPVTLQQCQRLIEDHTGKVPNTIRVSLGIASNFADVERLLEFVAGYRDRVR